MDTNRNKFKEFYSKYNIDKNSITSIDPSITDIYIHDIFIMILYNAYKEILYKNNNKIANILSLIIQESGYQISSFYKDPYITCDNFITYKPNDYSLQESATKSPTTDYSNYSTNNVYNLFNILSNSLLITPTQIYNTAFEMLSSIDSHCLNYINSNMIFNDTKLTEIITPILNNNNESNITMNDIKFLLNGDYNSKSVLNMIKNMGSQLKIDRLLVKNIESYYLLSLTSSNYIMNSIKIYDLSELSTSVNKDRLLEILYEFKISLFEEVPEDSFDIDNIIINPILSGTYKNILRYGDLFNMINEAVKSFYQIYLIRSGILLPMIDPINFPESTVDNIVYLFCDLTTNYTDANVIFNSLDSLYYSLIIDGNIYDSIYFDTMSMISTSEIIPLADDPAEQDYYTDPNNGNKIPLKKNTALSFFRGVQLLTNILNDNTLTINKTIFTNTLTDPYYINLDKERDFNIILNDINKLPNDVYQNETSLNLITINTNMSNISQLTMITMNTATEINGKLSIFDLIFSKSFIFFK